MENGLSKSVSGLRVAESGNREKSGGRSKASGLTLEQRRELSAMLAHTLGVFEEHWDEPACEEEDEVGLMDFLQDDSLL